jgi:plastocyanin
MKKYIVLFLSLFMVVVLNAQQTFIINSSGFSFSPSTVTVNQGDIVRFNVGSAHPVVQVSQSTWNANGTTALPGGFSFPSGTGDYTAGAPGTYYYVCSDHIGLGMKGTIIVNGVNGINDSKLKNEIKVFPNPSRDFIIFESSSNLIVQEIRILDITGKAVRILHEPEFSNEQVRINIENLSNGLYFILMKSDEGVVSGKLIKS